MTREQATDQAVTETRHDWKTRRVMRNADGFYILVHETAGPDAKVATVEHVSQLGQVVKVTEQ